MSAAPMPVTSDQRPGRLITALTPAVRWGLGCTAVACTMLVAALWLGGAAPRPAPTGLPESGAFTGWALPFARLVADGTAVLTVGFLLLPAVLLTGTGNHADEAGHRAMHVSSLAAAATAVAVGAQIFLMSSDVFAVPVFSGLTVAHLGWFLTGTMQGWACTVQLILATALAVVARLQRDTTGTWRVLVAALVLVTAPALVGHSAASEAHVLAGMSLVAHVAGSAVWVGGLASLGWLARRPSAALATAAPRFSRLALGCAIVVGSSGMVTGLLHAGSLAALVSSGYGLLLLGKAAALAVLAGIGWTHRRHTLPMLTSAAGGRAPAGPGNRHRPFLRLAAVELLVMAATYGLAVGLARSPV